MRLGRFSHLCGLLLVVGCMLPLRHASAEDRITLFALLVANNSGGEKFEPLRYAERDAEKFRDVLQELGGLSAANTRMITGATPDRVRAAMRELQSAMAAEKAKGGSIMLIFYYSGHAQNGEFWFAGKRLSMEALKDWFKQVPADIRVAFIDACGSGEITQEIRNKGGALLPSLVTVEHTRGQVLITSSSATENSQESDELGGSFFTHYLVSGLRGLADASGDGAVSLQEVYEFSYHQTVERTTGTIGGTQHPAYGFELAGQGDIVLTRPYTLASGILFKKGTEGSYLIYDLKKRRVLAEVEKTADEERLVAVPPGSIAVKKRRQKDILLGSFIIGPNERFEIDDRVLQPVELEKDSTKGLVEIKERTLFLAYSAWFGGEIFFNTPSRNLFYSSFQGRLQVEFLGLISKRFGLAVDLLLGGGTDDTTLKLDNGVTQKVRASFFRAEIGAGLNYHYDWEWIGIYAGPWITLLITSRKFSDPLNDWPSQSFGTVCPGVAVGTAVHLGDFDIYAEVRAHYLFYNIDGNQSLGFGGAYMGVAYRH